MKIKTILILMSSALYLPYSSAHEVSSCELEQLESLNDTATLGEIRKYCTKAKNNRALIESPVLDDFIFGAFSSRSLQERKVEDSEFVLTPHRMNFLLPVYTTTGINQGVYQGEDPFFEGFRDVESHFQVSLKFPLSFDSVFVPGDKFYGAFTLEAWWQVYAKGISSPFRETNYTPEFFYLMPLNISSEYGNTGLVLGVEHQSNGRSGNLSRSWNRVYAEFLHEYRNFVAHFRPWYRIPEGDKTYPGDPHGDDNPDIERYYGYGQVGLGYNFGDYKVSVLAKGNFATHKGSVRVDLTTPLYGRLKGYLKIHHGYGDSLIDYDHNQTRVGLGVTLNSLF